MPNGKITDYDRLQHSGAVTIIPVDEQANIYFVRQFRVGAEVDLLELPAGTLSKGEDPLDCAKRELREEIGMSAHNISLLGDFYLAPDTVQSICMFIWLRNWQKILFQEMMMSFWKLRRFHGKL